MKGAEAVKMNLGGVHIFGQAAAPAAMIEVCRSFAYKLNLANYGGPQYESADFFASRKMQCDAEAAAWVSQQLYEECVAEVRATVAAFIADMKAKRAGDQRELEAGHGAPAARPSQYRRGA
jgi:hypothetical protein